MHVLLTLSKAACIGGLVVGVCGYFTHYNIQRKIRQTPTYKKGLGMLYDHEKAVNYLGKPIKEGKIYIDEVNSNIRKFSVNVKGANTKGKLDCEYKLLPDAKIEISKVEIKFNDIPNQIFVIHEI